jgi:hypothetical protein
VEARGEWEGAERRSYRSGAYINSESFLFL